jgi:hypothetical protein
MKGSRIPIVLGVTGHRTFPGNTTDEQIAELLSPHLQRFAKRFPETPFYLLTPLAEGADRIVARLAMAYLDAELIVPLPMPLEEYEKDFPTPESLAEFRDLHSKAKRSFVVPSDLPIDYISNRDHAYARVGAYVAEHCQLLIAIWDGEPARGAGGTAEVVYWKSEGLIPDELRLRDDVRNTLNALDTGCVLHLNPLARHVRMLPSEEKAAHDFTVFDKIASFNSDVARLENSEQRKLIAQSQQWLVGDEADNPVFAQSAAFAVLKNLYGCADALAGRFKVANGRYLFWIFTLFVTSVLFFGLIDWIQHLIIFYVIAFPLAGTLAYIARRRRLEDCSLDYRALAEGLRVMIFWRLVGIRERVSANYLSKHSGVLSWIRMSIANLELIVGPTIPLPSESDKTAEKIAAKLWVDSELAFFRSRRRSIGWKARNLGRLSTVSFAATFVAAIFYAATLLAVHVGDEPMFSWSEDSIGSVYQAILGLLGAIGVASEAIRSKKAYDEQERRYHLIEELFSKAQTRLREGKCYAEDVFASLGKEALFENGEWLWIHRSLSGLPKG